MPVDSRDIAEGIIVHLSQEGDPLEIEVLDASKVVQKKEMPDEIPKLSLSFGPLRDSNGRIYIPRLLVETGMTVSSSEAVRLIDQGAVEIDGQEVTDYRLSISDEPSLKVGKHRFVKVINTDSIE